MKTIKISIQILLSLLLIPCIICSCLLFNASAFFQKDNISGILSELSSGNRILRYEYLSEDKDEDDFYAKLAETIPVQVALVVDISSENARICQEGAFEHIKELDLQSFVYNSLDMLANELANGYTQTAIDKKIINPNAYISYLNVHHERVTDTKKNLLMDTMYQKYRTILIGLDDENYFCALNADGRNTFLYILSSGRKAAETQNEVYRLIEEKTDAFYDEHLLNFFEKLRGNDTDHELIKSEEYVNCIEETIFNYLEGLGLSFEFADKEIVHRKLEPGIRNDLYQRFVDSLPLYEDTIALTPAPILSLINRLFDASLSYIGIGVCLLIILLIVSIDKKLSLYFIGASIFISGLIIMFGRSFSSTIVERLISTAGQAGNALSIIVPDLAERFLNGFSTYGIYFLIAGVLLFVLSIFVNRKKTV